MRSVCSMFYNVKRGPEIRFAIPINRRAPIKTYRYSSGCALLASLLSSIDREPSRQVRTRMVFVRSTSERTDYCAHGDLHLLYAHELTQTGEGFKWNRK